jgi:hypothetical protein
MKTDAVTIAGTPIYKIKAPKDLLRGKFSTRAFAEPRGKLCEYLKSQVELPACVIVHDGNKLSRIVKICEDGMLIPSDKSAISRKEQQRLIDAGILSKGFRK